MRCPYCNKKLNIKINPILLNDYRTRENQLLFYCHNCKKYYINKPQKNIERNTAIFIITFVMFSIIVLMLFNPLLAFLGGLLGFLALTDLLIFAKILVKGCMLECDDNFQPIIRKPNHIMIVSATKKIRNTPYRQFNAQLKINQSVFPILVTDIDFDSDTVQVHFFLPDEIEITEEQLTSVKSSILLRKKEVFEGIVCIDEF